LIGGGNDEKERFSSYFTKNWRIIIATLYEKKLFFCCCRNDYDRILIVRINAAIATKNIAAFIIAVKMMMPKSTLNSIIRLLYYIDSSELMK